MGQKEIIEFLLTNDGWHDVKAISERLNLSVQSTSASLENLRRSGEVSFKEVAGRGRTGTVYYYQAPSGVFLVLNEAKKQKGQEMVNLTDILLCMLIDELRKKNKGGEKQ